MVLCSKLGMMGGGGMTAVTHGARQAASAAHAVRHDPDEVP